MRIAVDVSRRDRGRIVARCQRGRVVIGEEQIRRRRDVPPAAVLDSDVGLARRHKVEDVTGFVLGRCRIIDSLRCRRFIRVAASIAIEIEIRSTVFEIEQRFSDVTHAVAVRVDEDCSGNLSLRDFERSDVDIVRRIVQRINGPRDAAFVCCRCSCINSRINRRRAEVQRIRLRNNARR